jgi:Holliday junction resolvase RusA-like endonuclease
MNISYTFSVPCIRPKGRPRFFRLGNSVRTYTDRKTAQFEKLVAQYALAAGVKPISGPVELKICATFAIPCSISKKEAAKRAAEHWHTQRPDLDNVEKAVLDALNGVAWLDDSQVCSKGTCKRWGKTTELSITVTSLGHNGLDSVADPLQASASGKTEPQPSGG